MVVEGAVPARLVAESAVHVGRPQIQIPPVEKVERALGDGGLEHGEPGQRPPMGMGDGVDVDDRGVEPAVLLVGIVDPAERLFDEPVIVGARPPRPDSMNRVRVDPLGVVLDQGAPDLVIEREQVVAGDGLPRAFERIGDRPGSTECIEHGCIGQPLQCAEDAHREPPLAALIARGGEALVLSFDLGTAQRRGGAGGSGPAHAGVGA
jgi:hypothetical protein